MFPRMQEKIASIIKDVGGGLNHTHGHPYTEPHDQSCPIAASYHELIGFELPKPHGQQTRSFTGGEIGIRTLGTREGHNGFRDRPDRPLRHLSFVGQR